MVRFPPGVQIDSLASSAPARFRAATLSLASLLQASDCMAAAASTACSKGAVGEDVAGMVARGREEESHKRKRVESVAAGGVGSTGTAWNVRKWEGAEAGEGPQTPEATVRDPKGLLLEIVGRLCSKLVERGSRSQWGWGR